MPSTHFLQQFAKTFAHLQAHILLYPKHSSPTMSDLLTSPCMKAHICQISTIIHTHHTKQLENLHKCLDIKSFDYSAFLTHSHASPNTSIAQEHAPVLSLVFILSHQSKIFCLLPLKFSIGPLSEPHRATLCFTEHPVHCRHISVHGNEWCVAVMKELKRFFNVSSLFECDECNKVVCWCWRGIHQAGIKPESRIYPWGLHKISTSAASAAHRRCCWWTHGSLKVNLGLMFHLPNIIFVQKSTWGWKNSHLLYSFYQVFTSWSELWQYSVQNCW